jgi:hypothetical protein
VSESGSAQKFSGGQAFFPFELNFKKFQPRFFSAGGEEPMVFNVNLAGLA